MRSAVRDIWLLLRVVIAPKVGGAGLSAGQARVRIRPGRIRTRAASRTTASRPPPGASRSSTVPPSAATSRWTIARPSPVPAPGGPARQKRSNARARCSAVMPGPLVDARGARRRRRRPRARRATVDAGGETSSAFESRLSSTCSSAPGVASAASAGRHARLERDAALARRAAAQASTRVATSCAEVDRRRPRAAPRRPARARAARRRAARAARPRRAPPSRSRPPARSTSRSRFSSRSRSAASGVRSWCDASATNSCCERSSASSRATVSLNSRASARTSGGPVRGARAVEVALARPPRPPARAPRAAASACARSASPTSGRGGEHDAADRREQQPVAVSRARRAPTSGT